MDRPLLHQALNHLASVCDGAATLDGQGFSAVDVHIGHHLASKNPTDWTDNEAETALQLARYYKGQLGSFDIDGEPVDGFRHTLEWEETREAGRLARRMKRQAEYLKRMQAAEPKVLEIIDGMLHFQHPKDDVLLQAMRKIPGRKWEGGNLNTFPMTSLPYVMTMLDGRDDIEILFNPLEYSLHAKPLPPEKYAELEDGTLRLIFPYRDDAFPVMKKYGGKFQREPMKHWAVPMQDGVDSLLALLDIPAPAGFTQALAVAQLAGQALQQAAEEKERQQQLQQTLNAQLAKSPTGEPFEIPGIKTSLLPHQYIPVRFALENRALLNADAPGLGKTLSTLATILAHGSPRAIVVCPSNLTPNWVDEIRMHTHEGALTPFVCEGTTPTEIPASANILIIGWAVLSKWVDALIRWNATVIAVDEGHYGKADTKSQRGEAFVRLGENPNAIRLSLTGTAIINRPKELLAHLKFLGKTAEFGGSFHFLLKYCDGHQKEVAGKDVWDFSGYSNLPELHDHLIKSGWYVRRTKAMLVDLGLLQKKFENGAYAYGNDERKPTRLQIRESDLAGYRRLEKGFQSAVEIIMDRIQKVYRYKDESDELVDAALKEMGNDSVLSYITSLRQEIGKVKIPYVLERARMLVKAGEKVIIAAHHRDFVKEYARNFTDLKIQGGMNAEKVAEAKRKFNRTSTKEHPVLVLSIEAAKTGHTLCEQEKHGVGKACAYMLVAEENWTYGDFEQLSDRIYRIGQPREVQIHSLIAPNTIDEYLYALREQKRGVVGAVLDGADFDEEETRMALLLARRFIQRHNRREDPTKAPKGE